MSIQSNPAAWLAVAAGLILLAVAARRKIRQARKARRK
jgi:hypothetical protein